MCGRIALFSPPRAMASLFDAALGDGVDPEVTPVGILAQLGDSMEYATSRALGSLSDIAGD